MNIFLITIAHSGTGFMHRILNLYDDIGFFFLNDIRYEHYLSGIHKGNYKHLLLQGHISFPVVRNGSIFDVNQFSGTIITTFRHPYFICRSWYVRTPSEATLVGCIYNIDLWLKMVSKYNNLQIVYMDIMAKISADDRLMLMTDKMPFSLNKKQLSIIREWRNTGKYKFHEGEKLYDKVEHREVEFTNKDNQLILDVIDNSGIMDRIASVSNYDLSPYQAMDLAFYDVWR